MINWGMFHFIRPMWLWALLLIPILIWLFAKRHSINSSWRHSVDLHLLTHLLVGNESRRRFLPVVALSVGLVVAVISMAGPSWSKLSQPVYQADITRMIVLDLSRSMDVPDVKPSRLTRAKFKVLDLLNKVKEGQVVSLRNGGNFQNRKRDGKIRDKGTEAKNWVKRERG